MARCGSCGSLIIMGGVRSGPVRYCNDQCLLSARQAHALHALRPEAVTRRLNEVWQGLCPICKRPGPVDVYKFHQVYSLVIYTRWVSGQVLACRSCGKARQLKAQLISVLLGWWGFPWGLIITPLQIFRNFEAGSQAPKPAQPSENLRRLVMEQLASELVAPAAGIPAQATPRRRRDPSAPLQEGDRVTVTVGDRTEDATILGVRDGHARCSFVDGRRAWVPLAALTLIPQGVAEDAPEEEARAPAATAPTPGDHEPTSSQPGVRPQGATPLAAARSAKLAAKGDTADIPIPGRTLAILYIVVVGLTLLFPFFLLGIPYWLPMIPYFAWRSSRPLRAQKWLPHALVILGLGIVNFVFPLRFLLRMALR